MGLYLLNLLGRLLNYLVDDIGFQGENYYYKANF